MNHTTITVVTTPHFIKHSPPDDVALRAAFDGQLQFVAWQETNPISLDGIVLIRSMGNYLADADHLADWLRAVPGKLFNHLDVCLWGLNKDKYLQELSKNDVPIIPSIVIDHASQIAAGMRRWGEAEVILKPCVGSLGIGVKRVRNPSKMAVTSPHIMQPFCRSILFQGEISCVFLGGLLSHSILKKPPRGDFRVQGGSKELISHPEAEYVANLAWKCVPEGAIAGRIDLVHMNCGWVVSEVEVLDPDLYLSQKQGSATNLIRAILEAS